VAETFLQRFQILAVPKADAIELPRFWLLQPEQFYVACVAIRAWQNGPNTLDKMRASALTKLAPNGIADLEHLTFEKR